MHFICDCLFHKFKRVKSFDYLRDTVPNFACLSSFDKMVWLMTCENKDIVNTFVEFVTTCFTLRKSNWINYGIKIDIFFIFIDQFCFILSQRESFIRLCIF